MPNVINGTSTGSGGLITSGDDSGILNIQTNETTAITVDASQVVTFAKQPAGTFAGTGPAFSAYLSATQNITTGTATKYAAATERFDTNNCYDTTNYRFTPNVNGYYQIVFSNWFTTGSTGVIGFIYRNGVAYATAYNQITGGQNAGSTALVYLNGSTDYVEAYVQQESGGTLTLDSSAVNIGFYGYMVRAA